MTGDSQRFFNPDVLARIAGLELRARQVVEGALAGRHRSPFFGHSVEFAQHREYVPGDDIRHLDWKIWAKSDRYYIKQFEDETNLHATLLVDVSESMAYGEGERQKYEYACTLAASLAFLLLQQGDAVGVATFDSAVRFEAPHRTARSHLQAILHALHGSPPQRQTGLEHVLRQLAERNVRRGLTILLSDLLVDSAAVLRGLRLLRQRGHDLLVFHLLHDDELDFLFAGMTRFEGLEELPTVLCDPRSLRDDYLAALQRHLGELARLCRHAGIDYRLVRTSEPMDAVVAALLHERQRA